MHTTLAGKIQPAGIDPDPLKRAAFRGMTATQDAYFIMSIAVVSSATFMAGRFSANAHPSGGYHAGRWLPTAA